MYTELKKKLLTLGIVEDNEYLDRYVNLIINNINTARVKYKTQKHHIIPRVVFQHNKEPLDNSKSNIVNLNYKEHILAHYYLFICATGWFKYSAARAVDYLVKRIDSIYVKSNAFNQIEINFSENDLLNMLPKLVEIEEQIKLCEHKRLTGGKWVNNGKVQKYIGGQELQDFLATNISWKIGKLQISEEIREKYKHRKPKNIGTKVINDGHRNKYVAPSEIDNYLQNGWILGRFDSPTKGKPMSEEAKQKISNTKKSLGLKPWNKGTRGLQTANKTTFKPGMTPHNAGRKYMNNSREEVWVDIIDIDYYKSLGFKLGRLPGSYRKRNKLEETI